MAPIARGQYGLKQASFTRQGADKYELDANGNGAYNAAADNTADTDKKRKHRSKGKKPHRDARRGSSSKTSTSQSPGQGAAGHRIDATMGHKRLHAMRITHVRGGRERERGERARKSMG